MCIITSLEKWKLKSQLPRQIYWMAKITLITIKSENIKWWQECGATGIHSMIVFMWPSGRDWFQRGLLGTIRILSILIIAVITWLQSFVKINPNKHKNLKFTLCTIPQ